MMTKKCSRERYGIQGQLLSISFCPQKRGNPTFLVYYLGEGLLSLAFGCLKTLKNS
jgi:hypothetical protein